MNKYINTSYLIAVFLVVGIVLWFASGSQYATQIVSSEVATISEEQIKSIMKVKVREQQAAHVQEEIILRGHSAPNRQVNVKAETTGQVVEILVLRGSRVKKGQAIVKLEMDDRSARLRKSKALLEQSASDYEAITKLMKKGHISQMDLNEAKTNLEVARAEIESIELEIKKTTLRAPFAGVLNTRSVEVGDYVTINDPVFTIIDDSPLIAIADLPQQHIMDVAPGQVGLVKLITNAEVEGTVKYVSASADDSTRTFPIEIEFSNPDGKFPSGVSVDIRIPLTTVSAHYISPAILVRNENGDIGVFTIDTDQHAQFNGIKIVRAANDGIWVSGLPKLSQIVSVGQGFIRDGERVNVIMEKDNVLEITEKNINSTTSPEENIISTQKNI